MPNVGQVGAVSAYRAARQAISGLPALPSHLRYLDEYEDEWRTIRHPAEHDVWEIRFDTALARLHFSQITDPDVRLLMKHLVTWIIQTRSAATTNKVWDNLRRMASHHGEHWFLEALERPVPSWRQHWDALWRISEQQEQVHAAKLYLHFMCEMCLGDFRPGHVGFVRSLPYKWHDNYLGVISGESLLTANEEAAIITHLDQVADKVSKRSDALSDETLTKACLLCICYQNGLRPVQIARVALDDLRVYEGPTVHILAYRAKKRKASEKTAFICKIKHEWAPMFVEYQRRRKDGRAWKPSDTGSEAKLFPMARATIISAIGDTTEALSGVRRTATDIRHSAAQRMADAGASLEEVATFLGHSDTDTSLAYFEGSPTQADKLNKALALSPVYRAVHQASLTRMIDKAALLGLPADQQVGGVPHGVPISGIGACDLGQSLCAKNPVLSCYTCRKFLPVAEVGVHQDVLKKLRPIVRFFFDESLGDKDSPAFVQMRVTLEQVQTVINSLEASDD